ncbi:hypothetical protein EGR_10171 [Echinococcus granulosus]|uniref:Uncharacterized protein n=1 Tax=Echinococcus granulosus TaxID=6210 RepID=W6U1P7_ECHGR|nr:hypothetical protein EGR_10171 [Echinococcus granulosus]EUB54963.1 hypothetical protein EGR_10171 [Echinococcus granulosus]
MRSCWYSKPEPRPQVKELRNFTSGVLDASSSVGSVDVGTRQVCPHPQ